MNEFENQKTDGDNYPAAYIDYLIYFHGQRDYFECHEVLEDFWKEQMDSPLRGIWLGLIQVAVASYHERRGNIIGASKMLASAIEELSQHSLESIAIDKETWMPQLSKRLELLDSLQLTAVSPAAHRFEDLNIPLTDQLLLRTLKDRCLDLNCRWGEPSELTNQALIHKHMLRDRSDVITAREQAKALRIKKYSQGGSKEQ